MRGELPPPEEILQAVTDELAQPKYRAGAPWWTRVLEALERAWVRFVDWLASISEYVGGPVVMAILVGAVLTLTVVLVTAHLGRRRARSIEERIRREHQAARGLDPADLEGEAEEAEAKGDHARAFRLLFRAALLRLDGAGLIDLRPGTTSGSVAEQLGSEDFAAVSARFDEVVYGDHPATPDDPRAVRSLLSHLLGARR
ncbi:MAG: DUF4129 domain-containing protein [Actinomycetota bacterium]